MARAINLHRNEGADFPPVGRSIRLVGLLTLAALFAMACAPSPQQIGGGELTRLVSAQPGEKSVTLSWQGGPPANRFVLYWSTNPQVSRETATRVPNVSSPYRFQSEKIGVTHYFAVAAVRGEEEAPLSQVASAAPFQRAREFPRFIAVNPQPGDTLKSLAALYLKDPGKDWVIAEFNNVKAVEPFQPLVIPKEPFKIGGLTPTRYQTVPILTYHHVIRDGPVNKMTVSSSSFEEQMRFLAENGYRTISMKELDDFLNFRGDLPEKPVLITFDDGWVSTYNLAFPILKKYNLKATLFLYSDLADEDKSVTLNWDQVRELHNGGMEIECHTKSHRSLAPGKKEGFEAYFKAVEKELLFNRKRIKEELGKECKYLGYPYGITNHFVIAVARQNGYSLGFTVKRGVNPFFMNNFRLFRSMVFGEYDLEKFKKELIPTHGRRALK